MNQIPGDSDDLMDEGYFSIGRVVDRHPSEGGAEG